MKQNTRTSQGRGVFRGQPPGSDILCNIVKSARQIPMKGWFLRHNDELYRTDKPFAFKFPADAGGFPSSNMEYERHEDVVATDMRGFEKNFTVEKNGFAVLDIGNDFVYDDFHSEEGLSRYFRAIELMLLDHLGAQKVQYFRHTIRKRHPTYPTPINEIYEDDQPTTVAHIDATTAETAVEIYNCCGEEAEERLKKRFQWLNIWKPLKGPSNDWPLLIGDAATFSKITDFEPADLLYTDHEAENMQIFYNSNQRWYYLSDHKTSEVIVFKQTDSSSHAVSGVPHCSCHNPLTTEDEHPRESIEVRMLVFYD